MGLWVQWWLVVGKFRPACSRLRSFLWMTAALAGLTVRMDLLGVTSIVRSLGLKAILYDRLLDCFHSPAVNIDRLSRIWVSLVLKIFPGPYTVNGKLVLLGDGIKAPKEGRKMPAVKLLHQESESNTKPEFIMGHSCQAVALLVKALDGFFAVPLVSRIHEGVVFSNRDKRTLLDKMALLIQSLGIDRPCYFIGDAYYACGSMVHAMTAKGTELITRVRTNAVAYESAPPYARKRRGRKRKYGKKLRLTWLFDQNDAFEQSPSPIYGELDVQVRLRSLDLLWKPVGRTVRFVWVIHPNRGRIILMTTDLTLAPVEVLRLYGLRFKIELAFKHALRTVGAYAYHFWMKAMARIGRRSGNQHLHRKSQPYRNAVRRKLDAYHRHIQLGLIAQGLLQYISCTSANLVWSSFRSWIRTIRPGICPSEFVTAMAMRNSLPEFLLGSPQDPTLAKFLLERIDFSRAEGLRLAG